MSFISGNGGSMTVDVLGDGTNVDIVHNSRYTLSLGGRSADTTTSASAGGSNYTPVIQDPSATIEIPVDDTAFPHAAGLVFGTRIEKAYFKKGGTATGYLVEDMLVDGVDVNNDNQNGVHSVTVRLKGGKMTNNAAVIPAAT